MLGLQPHPREGGYFRETYRSSITLPKSTLPDGYPTDRCAATAIYYLLTPKHISPIHRLRSDEVFHFYMGDPVEMVQLGPAGGKVVTLGTDFHAGHAPQVVAPAGVWQGSCLRLGGKLALIGCTVAPGFDYADYEDGKRDELIKQFPGFEEWIRKLCPAEPASKSQDATPAGAHIPPP